MPQCDDEGLVSGVGVCIIPDEGDEILGGVGLDLGGGIGGCSASEGA